MNLNEKSEPRNLPYLTKVWRLIHALSSKQKQDFKKSAAFHGSKTDDLTYVVLFDLVNICLDAAQKKLKHSDPHDESASNQIDYLFYEIFWQKFSKQTKIKTGDLSRICNYLYPRILESARYQNEQKSQLHDLLTMFKDIQFLMEKDLLVECKELIVKAKEISEHLGLFELQSYLLRAERQVFMKTQDENERKSMHEKLREIEKSELAAIENLKEMTILRAINQESFTGIGTQKQLKNDAVFARCVELFIQKFPEEPQHLTKDGKILWQNTMANFSVLARRHPDDGYKFLGTSDWEKTHFHQRKIVEIIMSDPIFLSENPNRTLSNLMNYILMAIYLNKQDEEVFQFFEKIAAKKMSEVMFMKTVAYLKISMFMADEKRFDKAIGWLEEKRIWILLKTYHHEIPKPHLQAIFFLGGLFYATKNRWEEAEKWFLENENDQLKVVNAASLVSSSYFLLVTKYEMGQFNGHLYPEHIIQSFQNRLTKIKGSLDEFDKSFCKMFQVLMAHLPKSSAAKNVVAQHFLILQKLHNDLKKPKSFQIILGWMEAKSENQALDKTILRRLLTEKVL